MKNMKNFFIKVRFTCLIMVLAFIVICIGIKISTPTPKDDTKEIVLMNDSVPEVHEFKTDTSYPATYFYSVMVLPNGEKTVYLCRQGGGSGQYATFGMAQAVHPDGTPVTPDELGITIPENIN